MYSCIRFIADAVASLPIKVYRTSRDGTPVRVPSSQFLDSPSDVMNPYEWMFAGTASALAYGNSVGLITSRTGVSGPDGLGYPASIDWLPMDRMAFEEHEEQPWNARKTRVYFDGRLLKREEYTHLRAFVIPGRVEAISPIRAFATLISQGANALNYSQSWFANGGFPIGTFENTEEEVDVQAAREIRQNLTDTLRSHQPLVYGRNWKYNAITVPPNEAAFIQAMQLNATQVAAIYGMPPSKVGGTRADSLTYATEQQETLSIINDTLRPWLRRWEVLLSACLPATQYIRFDTDELLKTDLATRYEIFQKQRNMGIRTIDELRASDDRAPLPHGAGGGLIPQAMLERMSTTTRILPKHIMGEVVLEQALIAELMEKLQKDGMYGPENPDQPEAPPLTVTPPQYLGRQITAVRSAGAEPPPEPEPVLTFGPAHIRASNTERSRAVTWIALAERAGCLDEAEAIRRTERAQAAGNRGVLAELTGDLPAEKELRAESLRLARPEPHEPVRPLTFAPLAHARLLERSQRWEAEPSPNGQRP